MRGRKTGGRRKGTPNKVTAEARAVCAAILDDPTYRTNLTARARAGTLAPAVEAMLWHYAFGKPRDSLDVTVGPAGDLSELSMEDLLHPLPASGRMAPSTFRPYTSGMDGKDYIHLRPRRRAPAATDPEVRPGEVVNGYRITLRR